MFKTKTAAKWLESVKKNTFVGILEKPFRRVFEKPPLDVPSVGLPSEALREQKIQRLESERVKTQALESLRLSRIR